MVNISVVLIVLTKEDILAVGSSLPITEYSTKISPFDLASQLLERYTGIKALKDGVGWIPLVYRPVVQDKDRLYIPYLCILPEKVKTTKEEAHWCPLANSADFFAQHEKIISSL